MRFGCVSGAARELSGEGVVHSPLKRATETHPPIFPPLSFTERNLASESITFLIRVTEDGEGKDKKGGHILHPFTVTNALTHSIWPLWKEASTIYSTPWSLRAMVVDSTPIRWASSHFLSILRAMWKANNGVFTAQWKRQEEEEEDMWKNEQHTFITPETDWTHPPFWRKKKQKNPEKINKKDSNINRAALGGLGEGWRNRRPLRGFATSPTRSLVLNHIRQCLHNWIFALKGEMRQSASDWAKFWGWGDTSFIIQGGRCQPGWAEFRGVGKQRGSYHCGCFH